MSTNSSQRILRGKENGETYVHDMATNNFEAKKICEKWKILNVHECGIHGTNVHRAIDWVLTSLSLSRSLSFSFSLSLTYFFSVLPEGKEAVFVSNVSRWRVWPTHFFRRVYVCVSACVYVCRRVFIGNTSRKKPSQQYTFSPVYA